MDTSTKTNIQVLESDSGCESLRIEDGVFAPCLQVGNRLSEVASRLRTGDAGAASFLLRCNRGSGACGIGNPGAPKAAIFTINVHDFLLADDRLVICYPAFYHLLAVSFAQPLIRSPVNSMFGYVRG